MINHKLPTAKIKQLARHDVVLEYLTHSPMREVQDVLFMWNPPFWEGKESGAVGTVVSCLWGGVVVDALLHTPHWHV